MTNYCVGRFDQQKTQQGVALFADVPEVLTADLFAATTPISLEFLRLIYAEEPHDEAG
jgi:hypothetical protein